MDPLAFLGLVLIAWEALRRRNGSVLIEKLRALRGRFEPSPFHVRIAFVVLVSSFAAQLFALYLQATAERADNWSAGAPLAIIYETLPFRGNHLLLSAVSFPLAALQTLCLGVIAIAYAARARRAERSALAATVAALAAIAVLCPLVTTSDIFEYLQCGRLQFRCYAPPAGWAVPPYLTLVAAHVPLNGLIYGPLWLAVNSVVSLAGNSLLLGILFLRLYSALVVLGTAALLAKLELPRPALIAFILNPYVWLYFVMDAHIDLQAFALVVAAFLAVRRRGYVAAVLCLAGAGLVKLTFVVVGGLALARVRPISLRIALWSAAIALALAASYAFGGVPYVHALFGYTGSIDVSLNRNQQIVTMFLQLTTALALLAAVFFGRRFAGQFWIFPTGISPMGFPWYLSLGFPYALEMGSTFTVSLAALPAAAALMDQNYTLTGLAMLISAAAVAILAVDMRASLKHAERPSAAPGARSGPRTRQT